MEPLQSYKTPFEFQFKLNDNIIVQRNFNILGFNSNAKDSAEFIDALYDCCNIIESRIKMASIDHLIECQHMYISEDFQNIGADDIYTFSVIVNDRVIGCRMIDASVYPTKIRYAVNIRKDIANIISILQRVLSLKDEDLTWNIWTREKTVI